MNVLVTSASRKVSLVQAFQRALAAEGGGRVVAADCEAGAAALFFADGARVVPRSAEPDFWPQLLAICREEQIRLLIPTRDEELLLFAEHERELADAGVVVPISAPQTIRLCQDKLAFTRFCSERGFAVARVLSEEELSDEASFPVFARTRVGKKSAGAFRVGSPAELAALRARLGGELLVPEVVQAPEYTLDVLCDLQGRVLSVVPRVRGVIVGGESFVSATVREPELLETGARLARELELRGPAVIQAFLREGRVELIEVNPRFGGASVLAIAAGADSPRCLVRLARGENVQPFLGSYRDGLRMLRYTQDLFVEEPRLEALRAQLRAV
ncbi:MAG: ATP-grasp domain-containing protein [Deltaproteobacteria bacterium]|nr:ATP-grasp domain-containing protein [Deltaproteobacteria bacterium]